MSGNCNHEVTFCHLPALPSSTSSSSSFTIKSFNSIWRSCIYEFAFRHHRALPSSSSIWRSCIYEFAFRLFRGSSSSSSIWRSFICEFTFLSKVSIFLCIHLSVLCIYVSVYLIRLMVRCWDHLLGKWNCHLVKFVASQSLTQIDPSLNSASSWIYLTANSSYTLISHLDSSDGQIHLEQGAWKLVWFFPWCFAFSFSL